MLCCLLASWCAGEGRRNSQITRYSFLPDIAARCLVIYQSPITEHYYILPRQASPCLLFRVDLCPLLLIKSLKRSCSAIFRASPPPSTIFTHESTVWFEEKCFHFKQFQNQSYQNVISFYTITAAPCLLLLLMFAYLGFIPPLDKLKVRG